MTDEPLPEWATGKVESEYPIGSQMRTRDGRRTGNGVIVKKYESKYLGEIIRIVTDHGNSINLTHSEVHEMFYPPEWVMDLSKHMPALLENLKVQLAAMSMSAASILGKRVQQLHAALPKTADGEAIFPGMKVFLTPVDDFAGVLDEGISVTGVLLSGEVILADGYVEAETKNMYSSKEALLKGPVADEGN